MERSAIRGQCSGWRCGPGLRCAASGLRILRDLVRQTVDALSPGKSGDRKLAEFGPAAGADVREALGRYDGAMQLAGDLLQPCCEIDGGADAGEVEPVAAADIAVEDLADMQRNPEAKPLGGVTDRVL